MKYFPIKKNSVVNITNRIKSNIVFLSGLCIISFIFLLCRSYSTSPLYVGEVYDGGGDSSHFIIIAKMWLHGRIPYREIFDHKGPYLYFIDMLGYAFTNNTLGIFLLQFINLTITEVGIYKIATIGLKEQSKRRIYGILAVILTLVFIHPAYIQGNICEEWCFPYIVFSTFFIYDYIINNRERFKLAPAFFGISFGICLMTRVTNGITVCAGFVVVLFIRFIKKEYKELLKSIIMFIMGLVLVCLPFLIYFISKNALLDSIFGILIYNILYRNGSNAWIMTASIEEITIFLYDFFVFSSIILTGILFLELKKYYALAACVLSFLLECYLFFGGFKFGQYMAICIAQIPLLLAAIHNVYRSKNKLLVIMSFGLIALLFLCTSFDMITDISSKKAEISVNRKAGYEQLMELVPENELQNTVAYGDNWTKQFYLKYDIIPMYRFFAIQDWYSSFDENIRNEIEKEFENGEAHYIIANSEKGLFDNVIKKRYEIVDIDGKFVLYRLVY